MRNSGSCRAYIQISCSCLCKHPFLLHPCKSISRLISIQKRAEFSNHRVTQLMLMYLKLVYHSGVMDAQVVGVEYIR